MKQLLTTLVVFSISSLLFIACSDKTASSTTEETKSTFDLASSKTIIEGINAEFASYVAKGDSVSLANFYTSDAKMLGANMPAASGRSAIQSAFAGMFAAMGTPTISFTTLEVWGNEAGLTEEGTYKMSDKDGKQIDTGKYLVFWKMEDGKWKLHRDCFNSDLPPMAPPK